MRLWLLLISTFSCIAYTNQPPIGQHYIDLIKQALENPQSSKELESLFTQTVKKTVNSKLICTDRVQLLQQMSDVEKTFGIKEIKLLELIIAHTPSINTIHFEVYYKDETVDSIIAILKTNSDGLIEEINEVFGQKEAYEWNSTGEETH